MNILITGGAGFIGANSAARFAAKGNRVTVFDDLSRKGSTINLQWLQANSSIEFVKGDTRRYDDIVDCIKKHGPFDCILHCAGQVAVTTSVANPRDDFERNAFGAFNLLEAVRLHNKKAVVVYASTNKVYGGMEDLQIVERNGRYEYQQLQTGVSEDRSLDFHSPYGCSKGAADQYFRDYARIYGLKTIVMRQSCIYGYRQFGVEDQGWVAWFCIAVALGKPITLYGDGKQVRDVLFIDDLVRLYESAFACGDKAAGQIFNIGGGPSNTLSLLELLAHLDTISGNHIPLQFDNWRCGDQRVFVADISLAEKVLGWKPAVTPAAGVEMLFSWVRENIGLFD